MKILIIEDETLAAQRLIRLLHKIDETIEVLAILESVEATLNWLAEHPHPDLMFVDVQLEDGLSFEIFETTSVQVPVIFTTAYDEYALKAFRLNSIDYLMKPIDTEDLNRALNKYKSWFPNQTSKSETGLNPMKLPQPTKERFLVKIGSKYRSIPVGQVAGFYISERATFMTTDEGKSYGIDYSLDKLEEVLDPNDFFRINRTMLVRYSAIGEMIIYSSSRLKLLLKAPIQMQDVLVSRERVPEFKKWMDR